MLHYTFTEQVDDMLWSAHTIHLHLTCYALCKMTCWCSANTCVSLLLHFLAPYKCFFRHLPLSDTSEAISGHLGVARGGSPIASLTFQARVVLQGHIADVCCVGVKRPYFIYDYLWCTRMSGVICVYTRGPWRLWRFASESGRFLVDVTYLMHLYKL